MAITKEQARALLWNIKRGHASGKRDLDLLLREFLDGDLVDDDDTSLLDVENPAGSDLLVREGGIRKAMTWNQFLDTILAEIGSQSASGSYFVDAVGGSDNYHGRSASTAWQTIAKVNASTFLPGDIIAFKGGQTHNGALILPSSGAAGSQIVFKSYGTGTAIIASGAAAGFTAVDQQYFTVDGLEFLGGVVGSDLVRVANEVDGIRVENSQAADTKLAGIRIINNTVHEYGLSGINVIGTNAAAGTAGVLIDNNEVYACTHNSANGLHPSGIQVCSDDGFGASANGYSHTGVIIRANSVHDNLGTLGDTDWSGSGINVGQTNAVTIVGNTAFNNGQISNSPAGPFGIRVADSTAVLVQANESYLNRVPAGVSDGGGILVGTGCTGCTVERNYTHGNHGSGIKLYAGADAGVFPWDGNTVRFNVSEDDHTRAFTAGGGIAVVADANMINVKVHNNTIYQRGGSPRNCLMLGTTTGILVTDFEGYIANNIIVAVTTAALVQADNGNTAFMRLRGNNYYCPGIFLIEWNGSDYSTYAAWQTATGGAAQEKISAVNVGLTVNPLLTNPASSGTINAVNSLLTAYKLQSASPMVAAGLDLSAQFSFSPGTQDFFGGTVATPFNIGASFATQDVTLTITGAPVLSGEEDVAYTGFTATAAGGVPAYTYSLVGSWPAGPTINSSSGVVSTGVLTTPGTYPNLYVRVTDSLGAVANLGPFTITVAVSGVVLDPLTPNIPEGTDNEAILFTATTALSSPTWTIRAGGVGCTLEGADVILTDKAAFFAQAAPTITMRATSGASHQDVLVNFNITAGYYDVGRFGRNLGMHWDLGDQGTYLTDEGDTYFEILNDKSSYARHMENPWFPDRRQRLGVPSTLKAGVNAFRTIAFPASSTYGLANPAAPIWHGMRYLNMTATSIVLTRAEATNNNEKTTFSGLANLLGRNLVIVIYGDANSCTLRIDGVQIQQKLAGAGYVPPTNSFLIGFSCRLISAGFIISPSHLGQHPWWEGSTGNYDLVEFFQLFNVQAG